MIINTYLIFNQERDTLKNHLLRLMIKEGNKNLNYPNCLKFNLSRGNIDHIILILIAYKHLAISHLWKDDNKNHNDFKNTQKATPLKEL